MPSNGLPPGSIARHIGGIQAIVSPRLGSQIRLQENSEDTTSSVIVRGNVTPVTDAQAVRVDTSWEDGLVDTQSVMTDKAGAFTATFGFSRDGGNSLATTINLTFQAHIIYATVLAPSDSKVVHYIATVGPTDPGPPK